MKLATGLDEFIRAPIGRFFVGGTFLFWCHDPTLRGWVLWGRLIGDDVDKLLAIMNDQRAMRLPYDVVHDIRRVESVDTSAFERYLAYVRQNLSRDPDITRRRAVVHGAVAGLPGLLAAGMVALLGATSRWRGFADPTSAFRWFGRPDADAVSAEVEALIESAVTPLPGLAPLRTFLAANVNCADIDRVADGLGLSPRSLQRLLKASGTSFRAEVERARMTEARRLLADTDLKIAGIARQVGYASAPRFAALFQRHEGETPSAYRARHRAKR